MLAALALASGPLAALAAPVAAAAGPLKVFVLAGQSNMEGQAEVSKICTGVEPGKCAKAGAEMNGTLTYQLTDPRTAAEFAPCWDKATKNWTVLPDVKIWFNEKGKVPAIPGCPLGCPVDVDGGTFGDMSIGFGVGGHTDMGDRPHIGPEYGFGFALHAAMNGEPVLIVKTAWGGKTLCGDYLPPSSVNATNNKTVGFYYQQMLQYVDNVLAPANLTKLFPEFAGKPTQIVGFGWDQGWNDGCGVACTDEYEQNSASRSHTLPLAACLPACLSASDRVLRCCCWTVVNLIGDLRKAWKNPKLAISIPVSGFDGWDQKNARRLGVINAQFGACNATRHPGMAHCVAEETRDYWRDFANSPVNQGYQYVRRSAAQSCCCIRD